MIVVLSCPSRIERLNWPGRPYGWTPYISHAPSVREAHLDLALEAITRGWDHSVLVLQDDTTITHRPAHRGDVTTYHEPKSNVHACPRAFTATTRGWLKLAQQWDRSGKTCELWGPDWWHSVTTALRGDPGNYW